MLQNMSYLSDNVYIKKTVNYLDPPSAVSVNSLAMPDGQLRLDCQEKRKNQDYKNYNY